MTKKLLNKGDCIGIVSPSSSVPKNGLQNTIKYFEEKGFKIKLSENVFAEERFLAGTDEQRAADLMAMFTDPEVDLILVSRGGYGTARLLDKLNYKIIKKNPKPLIGFSDTTGLSLGLFSKIGLPSYTGMMGFIDFKTGTLDARIEESFWQLMNGESVETQDFNILKSGQAKGILMGGCLSLMTSLMGTPYFPRFKNKILLIEEVKEEPYRVDRQLTQLRLAGLFDDVAGVVFGDFKDCTAKSKRHATVTEVLEEFSSYVSGPVITDFHYGHGDSRLVLPIGGRVKIDTEAKVFVTL
ncbi:MAG: S66 peptidase family protein [Alphaproteobacteria bacterium]